MSSGCGRQEASTRLQPVRRRRLRAARRPACRRVPAMPLDGEARTSWSAARWRPHPATGALHQIPKRDGTGRASALHSRAAQRGRDRFITPDVNRVRRCSPARSGSPAPSRGRAKPGGTLLTPTSARPSCRSPFDPIEGDAPPARGPSFSGGRTGTPVATETDLAASVEPPPA